LDGAEEVTTRVTLSGVAAGEGLEKRDLATFCRVSHLSRAAKKQLGEERKAKRNQHDEPSIPASERLSSIGPDVGILPVFCGGDGQGCRPPWSRVAVARDPPDRRRVCAHVRVASSRL